MVIGLIPARGGSQRIARKALRPLGGHPLIAYTIASAQQAGICDTLLVATDDKEIAEAGRTYGCETWKRDPAHAQSDSPDQSWMREFCEAWHPASSDCFLILRPSSPFLGAATINRAHLMWANVANDYDSMRAVTPAPCHPGKMWTIALNHLLPVEPWVLASGTPWHSSPTQALPQVYVQTAGLELGWFRNVERGAFAGTRILPLRLSSPQSLDLNTEDDWAFAEWLVETGRAKLPEV